MAAVCTTEEYYGAAQTVLSSTTTNGIDTFKCTCAGTSKYGTLAPVPLNGQTDAQIKCIIKYWECPILT